MKEVIDSEGRLTAASRRAYRRMNQVVTRRKNTKGNGTKVPRGRPRRSSRLNRKGSKRVGASEPSTTAEVSARERSDLPEQVVELVHGNVAQRAIASPVAQPVSEVPAHTESSVQMRMNVPIPEALVAQDLLVRGRRNVVDSGSGALSASVASEISRARPFEDCAAFDTTGQVSLTAARSIGAPHTVDKRRVPRDLRLTLPTWSISVPNEAASIVDSVVEREESEEGMDLYDLLVPIYLAYCTIFLTFSFWKLMLHAMHGPKRGRLETTKRKR